MLHNTTLHATMSCNLCPGHCRPRFLHSKARTQATRSTSRSSSALQLRNTYLSLLVVLRGDGSAGDCFSPKC